MQKDRTVVVLQRTGFALQRTGGALEMTGGVCRGLVALDRTISILVPGHEHDVPGICISTGNLLVY